MEFQDFLRELGGAIRAHRKAKGLTQEQLAEVLGVSTQWVSEMERGNGAPSLELLYGIATYLGTTPSSLARVTPGDHQDEEAIREIMAFVGSQNVDVVRAVATFCGTLARINKADKPA